MAARLVIAILFFAHATTAFASTPFVKFGDNSRPECIDAMRLAAVMYKSTAKRLYAPLTIPEEMQSRFILGALKRGISLEDAMESASEFEILPLSDRDSVYLSRDAIYWSREAKGELRIVVREYPVGWRGNMYDLYLLDETVQQETFLSNIDNTAPVISQTWLPPPVFRQDESGTKWFIDVGEPYLILADWDVYSAKEGRVICSIAFAPDSRGNNILARKVVMIEGLLGKAFHLREDPAVLLPKQVTALARKLDEALGPGINEGTLQPTARTRLDTKHILANAALRPWALSDDDAYNSRSEVDEGLEEWANVNRSRRRLYNEIRKEYPIAERSLTKYYESTYGLQTQKAKEVAAWTLDLIFRSFFVFTKGGAYFQRDDVRTNPWPTEH